jgi:hypothetical protein
MRPRWPEEATLARSQKDLDAPGSPSFRIWHLSRRIPERCAPCPYWTPSRCYGCHGRPPLGSGREDVVARYSCRPPEGVKAADIAHGLKRHQNRRAEALPVGEVGGGHPARAPGPRRQSRCDSPPLHRKPIAGLSPGLGGGILQAPWPNPCAAADAVDRRRLSKPSCPARLILFRYAAG